MLEELDHFEKLWRFFACVLDILASWTHFTVHSTDNRVIDNLINENGTALINDVVFIILFRSVKYSINHILTLTLPFSNV